MDPPDFLSKALTEPSSFIVLCTKKTKQTPLKIWGTENQSRRGL